MSGTTNNRLNKPKAANKVGEVFSRFVSKTETISKRLRIINKHAETVKQNKPVVGETKKGEQNVPPAESKR